MLTYFFNSLRKNAKEANMNGSYNVATFKFPLQQPVGILADLTDVQAGDTLIWDTSIGKFKNGSASISSTVVTDSSLQGDGSIGTPLGLKTTGVVPGSYTYMSANVNQYGQITAAIDGVTPLSAVAHDATMLGSGTLGDPLTVVAPVSTVNTSAPVTGNGSIATPVTLSNSPATPGTYTNATVTISNKGIVTAASSGVPPVSTVSTSAPISGDGSIGLPVTLSNAAVTPGVYTNATVAVDAKGLVQSASSGPTPLTTVATTAPLTGLGTVGTPLALSNSTATPGTYTNSTVTVDAKGIVQAISSGVIPPATVNTTAPIAGDGSLATPISLSNSPATPGTYTNATITISNKGIVQAASSGPAPLTSVTSTAPLTGLGTVGTPLAISDSAVTPGSYTNASITVDAKGILQAASSGPAPLTSVTVTAPLTGLGTVGTPLALSNSPVTPGSYVNSNITVDAKGIIQSISNGSGGGVSTNSSAGWSQQQTLANGAFEQIRANSLASPAGWTYKNTTNNVNLATGTYTCPLTGTYVFNLQFQGSAAVGTGLTGRLVIGRNANPVVATGANILAFHQFQGDGVTANRNTTWTGPCNAGDTITFWMQNPNAASGYTGFFLCGATLVSV